MTLGEILSNSYQLWNAQCDTFRNLKEQRCHPSISHGNSPSSNNFHRYERRELQGGRICYISVNLIRLAAELSVLKQHHLWGDIKGGIIKKSNQTKSFSCSLSQRQTYGAFMHCPTAIIWECTKTVCVGIQLLQLPECNVNIKVILLL